jgi:hypothetical protein
MGTGKHIVSGTFRKGVSEYCNRIRSGDRRRWGGDAPAGCGGRRDPAHELRRGDHARAHEFAVVVGAGGGGGGSVPRIFRLEQRDV